MASDLSISCYFPSEEPDLAVLAIPTFEAAVQVEFQDLTRQCLATANKLGKKRLIIDLRGNGGGRVFLGYDLFEQLFPDQVAWGTWNARAFPLMHDMGEQISNYFEDNPNKVRADSYSLLFNVDASEDIHLEDWEDWEEFYGPVKTHGDEFTNLGRYNLSDIYATGALKVSGYGNLTNIVPKQTFQAENIVLLQDGYCASTCTVFTEFMKTQAEVGQVAVGGRKKTGPMQGVGGVKGTNVSSHSLISACTH